MMPTAGWHRRPRNFWQPSLEVGPESLKIKPKTMQNQGQKGVWEVLGVVLEAFLAEKAL